MADDTKNNSNNTGKIQPVREQIQRPDHSISREERSISSDVNKSQNNQILNTLPPPTPPKKDR